MELLELQEMYRENIACIQNRIVEIENDLSESSEIEKEYYSMRLKRMNDMLKEEEKLLDSVVKMLKSGGA